MFTDRDIEQTSDTSDAEYIELRDGEDISITEAGVYVISGSAKNTTIVVETDYEAKVQLVLDGVSVSNTEAPTETLIEDSPVEKVLRTPVRRFDPFGGEGVQIPSAATSGPHQWRV